MDGHWCGVDQELVGGTGMEIAMSRCLYTVVSCDGGDFPFLKKASESREHWDGFVHLAGRGVSPL